MSSTNLDQRRRLDSTSGNAVRTARFERTSGGGLRKGWNRAFNGRERNCAICSQRGNRAQQPLRIRMSGRVKDGGLRAEFDQIAGIHHGHAVRHMRNHRQSRAR